MYALAATGQKPTTTVTEADTGEGAVTDATTTEAGRADEVDGLTEHSALKRDEGSGAPTQVDTCQPSPAGVAEFVGVSAGVVEVPGLSDEDLQDLAGMLEGTPAHSPATTPPVVGNYK